MGIVNFSIPKELVKRIVDYTPIKNFVETGTYKGDTVVWAANHFEKAYTIEIFPEFSKTASERPDAGKNIEFLVGNSKDVLPALTKKMQGSSFFWLDGHWCTGAGGKDEECPLIAELEALSVLKDAVIFIDDARCFLGPLPPPHRSSDWPMIDTIFLKIHQLFPDHRVTIIDDVIISVPPNIYENVICKYWQDTFTERYLKGGLVKQFTRAVRKKLKM